MVLLTNTPSHRFCQALPLLDIKSQPWYVLLYRMNTTNTHESSQPYRQAAVNGLAVIGFVALIGLGVWGAIYSARFVPETADRIGTAAVYLGSLFTPGQDSSIPANLSVVPTPTTISFGTTTPPTATTTSTSQTPITKPTRVVPATTAGTQTSGVRQIGTVAPAPYGLPDLSVTISAIGYLTTDSADSFVGSGTVPAGKRPAVKFTIKNVGTNWSGTWRFNASIPTKTTYTYESERQQSLAAGDSIDYVLGFDRASTGTSQPITITANFDKALVESNMNNNTISANLTILAS